MNDQKKYNILVVTFPFNNKAGDVILQNFISVLDSLSDDIRIITGNVSDYGTKKSAVKTIKIPYEYPKEDFILIKALRYLKVQLQISINLFRASKDIDVIIFFLGGTQLLLPVLTAKLRNKPLIGILSQEPGKLEKGLNFIFFKKLIVYSKGCIKQYKLEKYRHKVTVAPRHFLDFDNFKNLVDYKKRSTIVGYVGRFSKEKGVLNFLYAIPGVAGRRADVRFLIVGEGELRDEIKTYVEAHDLSDRVQITGWVSHENLPGLLNQLRLLVIPSYTEGLPNIMLEAMACGTPVLAMPVGGIPDVIIDQETGFILSENTSATIVEKIMESLEYTRTDQIIDKGIELIKKEYTRKAAIERYHIILYS